MNSKWSPTDKSMVLHEKKKAEKAFFKDKPLIRWVI